MTTHHRVKIVCECGHAGTLHWKENDQPFSKQWESYSVSGFEGDGFYIEGYTTDDEALKRINLRRPECHQVGKVSTA